MENKSCQNCKKEFVIDERDALYYSKINVPHPTWCAECRLVRRFSFQNTWNMHWSKCEKCGERTLCIFTPEKSIKTYCQPCWWADDWDGTEYAMDYDPARPFLEQVKELINKTPHSALTSLYTSNKNCDYANALAWCKDSYMVFWADFCENIYYSSLLNTLKFSSDCLMTNDSELCYELINVNKSYNVFFSEECDACVDVWFSRNCYSCTNCIGCVNLRGASYCIFNEKYSKEEYAEKVKELGLDSWNKLREVENRAQAFWLTKPKREYSGNSLNVNVTGEYISGSKNSHDIYLSTGSEDCRYSQFITVSSARDCYDYSGWGNNSSRIYEGVTVGENADSVYFSAECWPDVFNLQYCYWNISGKNNFGCANLKRKSYCILNKEYSKEEFEKLKVQIIEDMKKNPYTDTTGKKYYYGEFFPPEFSKFDYNKSNAMRFFPKTKESALSEGYSWSDIENPTIAPTMKSSSLPETIKETSESILNEIIECSQCSRAYKIVKGELDLLRRIDLPIPHECPKCRENKRFSRLNPIKLWKRSCAKCNCDITTAFAPERPEVVYCEKCYQGEFV
jgi:hypothetical protein